MEHDAIYFRSKKLADGVATVLDKITSPTPIQIRGAVMAVALIDLREYWEKDRNGIVRVMHGGKVK